MIKTTFKDYLKESLNEMAIKDYQTIGDFSKNSSFRDKRDRMLIQNPRSIELVKKKFNNTDYDFNFYFVNSAKANRHTEVGVVNPEWLKTNLGDDVYNAVTKGMQDNDDTISVVFTNNKGSERRNLTGWMMAHRIFHALAIGNYRRENHLYIEASNFIISTLKEIMHFYGNDSYPDNERRLVTYGYGDRHQARKDQLGMIYFFQKVCTFRSAREGIIRDWFEVLNELGAQYLTTGRIRFNDAPQCFGNNAYGKNAYRKCVRSQDDLSEVNELLETLSRDLTYYLDNILGAAVNKIFVM